jgi:hypothetical protein
MTTLLAPPIHLSRVVRRPNRSTRVAGTAPPTMCERYRPWRRSSAPFAPGTVGLPYPARIAASYSAVNDRRRG